MHLITACAMCPGSYAVTSFEVVVDSSLQRTKQSCNNWSPISLTEACVEFQDLKKLETLDWPFEIEDYQAFSRQFSAVSTLLPSISDLRIRHRSIRTHLDDRCNRGTLRAIGRGRGIEE